MSKKKNTCPVRKYRGSKRQSMTNRKNSLEAGSQSAQISDGVNREKEQISEKKMEVSGAYQSVDEWKAAFDKWVTGQPVEGYARYDYPALKKREEEVAKEVGVDKVLLYNSGMSAINDALESLYLTKGDVLLYSPSVYGESKTFIEKDLVNRGVKCIPIESGKIDEVKKLINQYHPKAIFTETVGNAPDMPVVDLKALFEKTEQMNEKYQKELKLSNLLYNQLIRKSWITTWRTHDEEGREIEEHSPQHKQKLEDFVELGLQFEKIARKINQEQSYIPLKDLLYYLEEKRIRVASDRRGALLELKSIIDTVWLAKRETPMTLILDNTLPTETGLNLAKKIKKTKAPVLAVDSGTKFFALDKATMGLVYSNNPDKMTELYVMRMRSGSYLPKGSEALLPERTKEEFDVRNKQVLKNAKSLAQSFAKLVGKIGVKAVSHPNLPIHPNYEYAEKNLPDGATAVFYIQCENAWETAKKLEEAGLKDKVEYGGSFAFEKTRVGIFGDTIIRIAAGNESPEELGKIIEVIESVK